MATYHYAAPAPIRSYDGVRVQRVLFDAELDLVKINLVLVLGLGASAAVVGAREVSGPAGAFLSFLTANFGTLGGASFFDKVLSALAHPTLARIPAGGSLV